MAEHIASRTLVKSGPELWAECSDPASLARHLGAFGEIRITRLEPETAVAWEGEDVSGTVTLEPAGWGTRVILTALEEGGGAGEPASPAVGAVVEQPPVVEEPEVVQQAPVVEEPEVVQQAPIVEEREVAEEPEVVDEHELVEEPEGADQPAAVASLPVAQDTPAAPRTGFFARLFARFRGSEKPRVDEDSGPVPAGLQAPDGPPVAALPTRRREPSVSSPPSAGPYPGFASVSSPPSAEAEPEPEPNPEPEPAPEPEPKPMRTEPPAPQATALVEALDSLGRAHHRPYSRG